MSSRTLAAALAGLLIAILGVAVPSLAASNASNNKDTKASTSQIISQKAAADKAAAAKKAAAKEKKPCPPQSGNGHGNGGAGHPNNGKHCGAQVPAGSSRARLGAQSSGLSR